MPDVTNRLADKTYIVGIGAQKAGTSWLHRALSAHPQIAMSGLKELHFYDAHHGTPEMRWDETAQRERLAAAMRQTGDRPELLHNPAFRTRLDGLRFRQRMFDEPGMYAKYFQHLARETHRAFGEITPAYAALPLEGFRAMRDFHPRIRVIFLMRDPVSRLWSAFKHACRESSATPTVERFAEYVERPRPRARSDSAATLGKLERVFQPGEVWIGFYETLFCEASMDSLAEFIGVSRFEASFETRVNAAPRKTEPIPPQIRELALRHTTVSYRACVARFQASIPDAWDGRGVTSATPDLACGGAPATGPLPPQTTEPRLRT